ncbi:hypothetical protein NFI96_022457 [Prochilodus magdalenae]|nr:hypothetical protein NFI96_022457 [Prochilodus magdalenae]
MCRNTPPKHDASTPVLHSRDASHSLQFFYTGVTGFSFPEFSVVGMVDGEQTEYYDSYIGKVIPKTDWMEKNVGKEYWDRETNIALATEDVSKTGVVNLMKRFNQTEGVHILQVMYGCELHDDGTKTGHMQFGYDGEDFLSLDVNTYTWTAVHPKAVLTKQKMEAANVHQSQKQYLETECIHLLQTFVGHGRSILEREVPPEVSLFQKDSSSPVVCHATGFFPKAVMISWQKNGEDLDKDVVLRETLPNLDGTFQKRSILTVSPEELDKHTYTCIIQHSGLEKVLLVSDHRVRSDGGSVGIIAGAVGVLLFILTVCVGGFIWKKKQSGFRAVSGSPSAY